MLYLTILEDFQQNQTLMYMEFYLQCVILFQDHLKSQHHYCQGFRQLQLGNQNTFYHLLLLRL